MKRFVCAVRDRQMDAFGQPIFTPTAGVAVRAFSDQVNQADSELSKHPQDYELFHIGFYEDETGAFENVTPPKSLCVAANVVVKGD